MVWFSGTALPPGPAILHDAHNHLQDRRLDAVRAPFLDSLAESAIGTMVVNGTHPGDWDAVASLATRFPDHIIPAYGVHPWKAGDLPCGWENDLRRRLQSDSRATVGETGLDRWIQPHDIEQQAAVFRTHLDLATELDRPITIHCLRAFGRVLEEIRERSPPRGFLLHAYGGSVEMVPRFADLGAWFSTSAYAAHEKCGKYRDALRAFPRDRLLVETDAPAMCPPDDHRELPATDPDSGDPVNHPANIAASYRFAAHILEISQSTLTGMITRNLRTWLGTPD